MNKRNLTILVVVLLLSLSASAQFFQNTVVKIRPNKALFALHPNLGFEKPVHRNFSITTEIAYKTTCMYNEGYEWFGGARCNGGEFYLGARGYWGKVNKYLTEYDQKAPFGWYGEVLMAYKGFYINDFQVGDFGPAYHYVEDVTINEIISYFLVGYQFNVKNRVSFDLNLGFNCHWFRKYRHDIVSIEETDPEIIEAEGIRPGDVKTNTTQYLGLAARFTFGYYIRFRNSRNKPAEG